MKISRKKLRHLIKESLQAFHYAIKPGYMRDKIKADPKVNPLIKTLLDDPVSARPAFELTRASDPTGEYGKELDRHDHGYLSSPEYERMFKADMQKSSEAYRSAPFKAMINKLLDDSGLRSGLANLKIDIYMNERKNKPQGMIISTNPDQLKRFKEFLDAEGGMVVRTWPEEIGRSAAFPGSNMPSTTEWSFYVLSN